ARQYHHRSEPTTASIKTLPLHSDLLQCRSDNPRTQIVHDDRLVSGAVWQQPALRGMALDHCPQPYPMRQRGEHWNMANLSCLCAFEISLNVSLFDCQSVCIEINILPSQTRRFGGPQSRVKS